jgi:dTDP-4-dehydrorhamnose reductase
MRQHQWQRLRETDRKRSQQARWYKGAKQATGHRMVDRKLLILGASGFIGSYLIRAWANRPLLATYMTRPIPDGVLFDVSRERLKDRILRPGHGITHAILAQGISKLEECARMRAATTAINVTGTLRAIDDLLEAGVHLIFLSSDAVFDGRPGLRTETDEPCPILSYGRDKRAVETYLSEQARPWTILRLTKVIAGFTDHRNPLSQWLAAIERGQPIRCATDQNLTPVDIDYVTQAILFFVATCTQGIFHISGSEVVTRYALLQRLLAQMPAAARWQAIVRRCSVDDFATLEELPHNCALSNAKFVALSGTTPHPIDELCAELCTSVFYGAGHLPNQFCRIGYIAGEARPKPR